jgi:Fic family protein
MDKLLQEYQHISFKRDWTLDQETIFMLGQCEVIIRAISSAPIKPEYRESLLQVSLRKGARATTAIEGNTLSDEEVAKIAEGEKLPPSKEYLETEVKNILVALNTILNEVVMDGKATVINTELIKNFHHAVGKNLGDHFQAIPGQFRASGHNVTVGKYRPPEGHYVNELMKKLCEWMKAEFHYERGEQHFTDQVIQAIVFHAYIAWIHPFGDGNGRTARLVEFYILLRAGLPDIASHILSNFYNDTRDEYYRQLDASIHERSLTHFIKYAVRGFRDELNSVLQIVQGNNLVTSWEKFIYETLDSKKVSGKSKAIIKRRRTLAINFPVDRFYTIDELLNTIPAVIKEYAKLSQFTLKRDLSELERLQLVAKKEDRYTGNIGILKGLMPRRKV